MICPHFISSTQTSGLLDCNCCHAGLLYSHPQLVKSPISANVGLEYAVTGSGLVQVGQSASLAPESAMHASIANERDHGQEEEAWE